MANDIRFRLAVDGAAASASQVDSFSGSLARMNGTVGSATSGLSAMDASARRASSSMADFAKGALLGAGLSVAGFAGKLVSVQREFDVLNSSMKTVTGSAAAAEREFAWIKVFAAETPFGLAQATQAFVKMKALGLAPTQSALTSFGNTASAMGKDLNQMIEAVADASTGEFERLKEFGIKASKQGDQVALTFQGITTTIGNSSTEIVAYLEKIGNVDFAGAMAERAATLDGAISALGDSWDGFFRTISSAGASQALKGDVVGLANYLDGVSGAMERAKKSGDGFVMTLNAGLGYAIARVPFDTLSVASNTLNGTINLLTGSVFGLRTNLDLLPDSLQPGADSAAAIGKQLLAAEANLAQLQQKLALVPDNIYLKSETYQAFLLAQQLRAAKQAKDDLNPVSGAGGGRGGVNPQTVGQLLDLQAKLGTEMGKYASKAEKAHVEVEKLRATFGAMFTPAMEKTVRESFETKLPKAAKAIDEAAKGVALYNDLVAKNSGYSANYAEQLASLSLAASKGALSLGEVSEAVRLIEEQQPGALAAAKALEDQTTALYAASSALVKAAVDEAEKNEELARTFGMTKAAIEQLELARLEEQLAQKTSIGQCTAETAALEALIDAKKRNMAAVGSLEAQKSGADAAKVTADEWKKTAESINSTLTDALMRGFESGKGAFDNLWDSIKNTLKTSVLKVLIQPVTGALTSMTMSGMAAAGQGGGTNALTNLSAVQSLKSLYDTASGGLNVGAKLGQYLVDNVGGQMVGDFAAGMTNVGSIQSATMAAQAGGAQLAGVIAGSVLNGVSGYGISKALSGGFSIDGFNVNAIAGIASMIPGIGPIAGVIGGLVNRAFGQGATEVRAQGTEGTFSASGFSGNNYAQLHRDGGWFSSDSDWKTTSALSAATAKAWGDAFAGVKVSVAGMAASLGLSTANINDYSKSINLAAGSSAETITAMFGGMADEIAARVAPGLAALAKQGETASATLSRLGTSLTTTNQWLSLLRQRLLGVSLAGGDAASKLSDAFGGLDKFTASAKSFYELYTSEGDRSARSMSDMAQALALVGLALPDSKDALKDLAGTLDLTTDAGRTAYAVLLAIAPEYAATADALAKLSKDAATQLLATFTGNGLLVPVLDAARLKMGDFTGGVQVLTGDLSFINRIMGDASSGVISLGSGVVQLDIGLSKSQLSAGLLTGEMDALRERADKTRIDFAGLGMALLGVDTATFVNTIGLVFANLATRISGVIGSISGERVAVREAAINIIGPQVMSRASIAAEIAAIRVSSSAAPVSAAGRALNSADAELAKSEAAQKAVSTASAALSGAASKYTEQIAYYKGKSLDFEAAARAAGAYYTTGYGGGAGGTGFGYNDATNRLNSYGYVTADSRSIMGVSNAFTTSVAGVGSYDKSSAAAIAAAKSGTLADILNGGNAALSSSEQSIAAAKQSLVIAQAQAASAASVAVSTLAAKAALLAYTAATQDYIVEASKSAPKLTKLREETLKYYEAQKQLTGLMTTSAASIRSTISAYTFSQKTDEQKFQDLAGQFSTAYSMSKITTGETLAGYGDKINALINPMIESLTATGRDGLIASYLAQAESVASSIDASVISLGDYQADSLSLLGSIDGVLAELDDGTQAVARAVKAAGDATLNGLAAVVSAITHTPAPSTSSWSGPAFANGGAYQGGLALVGEQGPELINFDQPGQVYTASQTRGMLSGGSKNDNADVVAELRALRRENADLRAEMRATAIATTKLARQFDRLSPDGDALATRAVAV